MEEKTEGEEAGNVIRDVVKRESARATSGVAPWTPSALALMDPEEFEQRLTLMAEERRRIGQIQRSIMVEGRDWGVIPGTDKPALYQPGAQVLNKFAGFSPEYRPEKEAGNGEDAPAISYRVRCQLIDSRGTVVSEGFGSSNSHEVKHRYRYGKLLCPICGADAVIKGKEEYGGGWLCFGKKGGCGEKWRAGAPEIESQDRGLVQNPDPHDLDNTLLKMGCKRAYMAATVNAHAISDAFTQDWEDLSESAQTQLREGSEIAASGRAPDPRSAPKETKRRGPDPAAPISQGQRELIDASARKRAAQLDMGPESPNPEAWTACKAWARAQVAPGREVTNADGGPIMEAIQVWEGETP